MKRTVPLLITAVVGFVLVFSAFVPVAESWGEESLIWFNILAGIAFVLGGASLCGSQLRKISARRRGWGYALVTLLAFLVTLGVGVLKLGVRPAPNQEFYGESFAPLAVDDLPAIDFQTSLPDAVRNRPLPPSVRRQVTVSDSGLRIAGWLTPSQIADLSDIEPTLDWRCSIERLAAVAAPPAAFRGRLTYRPHHKALGFHGVMAESEQAELRQLAPDRPAFAAAIDQLAEKSRRTVTVAGAVPPPGFELPASLESRATLDNGVIHWIGPMSRSDRQLLATGGIRSRIAYPLSASGRQALLEELSSRAGSASEASPSRSSFPLTQAEFDRLQAELEEGGPLSASEMEALQQQKDFERIVSNHWADDLILALNTAGVPEPGVKSACELVAERDRGVTNLDPVIPAGDTVELTDAQKGAITQFVTSETHDWGELESALMAGGPFTPAQSAALAGFRAGLPTIGHRNRQLFDALVKAGDLTSAQREFLLQEYEVERSWQAAVGRLFFSAHDVKYAWSGEFNQQGSQFWWLFEYVYQPIQSMMFALLAFYVASAAFRAFRAKNVEAILLLGTAFIILLGRTYVGSLATAWLPKESPLRLENLSVDIMLVFNSAGNRAIMIGIALGIASTSLKILLGIDRSHIGGKD